MTKNSENLHTKILKNHTVPDYTFTICSTGYSSYTRLPSYYTDSIFDKVVIDYVDHYMFKSVILSSVPYWYMNDVLQGLYHTQSIPLVLKYRDDTLPKKCLRFYNTLCDELTNYLSNTRTRISSAKVRYTCKIFCKNLSRLKYHNKFSLTYSSHKTCWVDTHNCLSRDYFIEIINLLASKSHLVNLKGFKLDKDNNIQSCLVINPNFITECLKSVEPIMEDSFRQEATPSVVVKDPTDINLEQEIRMKEIEKIMDEYNEQIKNRSVIVNGFKIPELFFRRIFLGNLGLCGRIYEKGNDIQGVNETVRSTILIDHEPTVEKDYKSLHIALAYEEVGIKLENDPYDFPTKDIELDEVEIQEWCNKFGIPREKYNPVRNFKKMVLLTLINADSDKAAMGACAMNIKKDYRREDKSTRMFVGIKNAPVKEAVQSAKIFNSDISDYLCSGVGIRFQNLDSQMIEYCIERFLEVGEVLLPVHDSIIVKKSYEDFAVKCMHEAYQKVMGSSLNCRVV